MFHDVYTLPNGKTRPLTNGWAWALRHREASIFGGGTRDVQILIADRTNGDSDVPIRAILNDGSSVDFTFASLSIFIRAARYLFGWKHEIPVVMLNGSEVEEITPSNKRNR